MQKLQDYWSDRSSQQKITLVAAFVGTFLAIAAFAVMANRPSMALLYAGLDPQQAGEVVTGVERSGVPYEVRGDSIYVDSRQRDKLRMDLAGQGLPAAGSAGYEILDGMSGFGTTSQMFDAAYWRAKEGELARTILALPNIKTARVHLAVANQRGLRRESAASASVTLTTNGAAVTRQQASALKYLVSSGVPGMDPEKVAVIDSERGMVATAEDLGGADRAADMKRNVERILEPHVGFGNAIVELNLDLVTEREQMTEQRFDPTQRAMISQVTEETSDQSNSQGSGAVTAASNLPEGQQGAGDSTQSNRSENRQQANFEVSSVTREVLRQPGSVRRMTVAVLVNGVAQDGGQVVPRPEAELEAIRELVASAVGFDAERGDQITVKSLPFAALGQDGTLASPAGLMDRLDPNGLARLAIIGLFALAVAFVVLRPMLRGRNTATTALNAPGTALLDDSRPTGGMAPVAPQQTSPGIIEPPQSLAGLDAAVIGQTPAAAQQLSLPPADPVARLRNMMKDRQDESMKILSNWIDKKEGTA
ncbi:MAG: flagellar basal-body MS-ring/collar protein FliF [Paracoccus sp. (in: a-proteobacteria)]|uniref:flagellar basal-body MS-ring/collar protein FliF n=1 Tax=Paracoccus sp. TaxID=267 RepID=UPI0026E0EB5D|nr:flagellar basal-body MS-ring/collar protein FliF [Paracoccus sp. (in: a-proteobacteria)]MDO5632026.1 flagellar basal-body MS-ring/collar protein FliF [Paracoccus sp. (in: a-proteobacteria)]